ncbi:MAG: DUF4290 domain-containing protein [Bacteroidota bacterium]
MHNYYPNQDTLVLPTYGQHVQSLVKQILTIKDKQKRNQHTHILVSLIQKIQASGKKKPIPPAKIWHDIWVMSAYKIDIDSPFEKPKKTSNHTLAPIQYHTHIPDKHAQNYGYNLTNYIKKIATITHKPTQEQLLIKAVKLIAHLNKRRSNIDLILKHIREIGGEKLAASFGSIKSKLKT